MRAGVAASWIDSLSGKVQQKKSAIRGIASDCRASLALSLQMLRMNRSKERTLA
jgi:hypothetical protein